MRFWIRRFWFRLSRLLSFVFVDVWTFSLLPARRRRATEELRERAPALGLTPVPRPDDSELRTLSGRVGDHEVIVRQDEVAVVQVLFRTRKRVTIQDKRHPSRRPADMVEFETSNWRFTATFKVRWIQPDMVERITSDEDLLREAVEFHGRWMRSVLWIGISQDGIACYLRYGHPWEPYVPAGVLERLLPEITDRLAAGGWLILSGVTEEESEDISSRAGASGAYLVHVTRRSGWVCLLFRGRRA